MVGSIAKVRVTGANYYSVLVTSESMTALDAIKLGDFGLGVILTGVKDPTTYAGTKIYLPPVSVSVAAFPILCLKKSGNCEWATLRLENTV
jgi:hypothetical protein